MSAEAGLPGIHHTNAHRGYLRTALGLTDEQKTARDAHWVSTGFEILERKLVTDARMLAGEQARRAQ
ncbi:hypothetical protein [Burkholderia anthina]|uniref:hypothetical protein n=1 Tax=Burkholderia anthina TaxID=179879 RepID=UPI00158AA44F|nr:hypothetical protein [Burkholderia anthina]